MINKLLYQDGFLDLQVGSTIKNTLLNEGVLVYVPEARLIKSYSKIFYRHTPYLTIAYAQNDFERIELDHTLTAIVHSLLAFIDDYPQFTDRVTPITPGSLANGKKPYNDVFKLDLYRSNFIFKCYSVIQVLPGVTTSLTQLNCIMLGGYDYFDLLDVLTELYDTYQLADVRPLITKNDLDSLYNILSVLPIDKIDLEKWRYLFAD